ncbi:hypothetical protein U1Q18_028246, partial [Sarracenia purpurea var. burkii]
LEWCQKSDSAQGYWWVEDLCELEVDYYKRVITNINNRGIVSGEVVGEALKVYTLRKLPGFLKGTIQCSDTLKAQSIVDVIVWLLPANKGSVSCSFLLKLLKAAILVGSGGREKMELVRRIGHQLEEASVNDLLIQAPKDEALRYDVEIVHKILEEFIMLDQNAEIQFAEDGEILEVRKQGILTEASKLMVAKLVDGYLAEIAKDPNLPSSTFVDIANMVSGVSRPAHDGLYRAIDTYLKVRAFLMLYYVLLTFSCMDPEGKLIIRFRKASNTSAIQIMGFIGATHLSSMHKGALSSESFFSGVVENLPIISGYSGLLQSQNGSSDPNVNVLSKPLNSTGGDFSWLIMEKYVSDTKDGLLPQSMLVLEKKRSRNIGSKIKRLLIDSQDALELKLTWEEAQDMLCPPLSEKPSVVTIEDHEFEEWIVL